MDLLSQMQHPNIISLLGYSIHGETRLLVYELMDNGSLETQLYGKINLSLILQLMRVNMIQKWTLRRVNFVWLSLGPSRGSDLNWHRRMKIALDMAR